MSPGHPIAARGRPRVARPAARELPVKTPLPLPVRELLGALGDAETLEILLALARSPLRYFSTAQLIEGGAPERRRTALEKLAHLNLADVRLGADVLYRYAPATRALERAVTQLTWEYEQRRETVLAALDDAHRG